MAIELSQIFSSQARTRTLETLYYQPQGIPLRHVGYLAELPVFSIECALKKLLKERIVKKKKSGNRTLFSLNKKHASYELTGATRIV